jgi:hypothetical protein
MITLQSESGKWKKTIAIDDPLFAPILPPPEASPLSEVLILPGVLGRIFEEEWPEYEKMLRYIEGLPSSEVFDDSLEPASYARIHRLLSILNEPEGWRMGVYANLTVGKQVRFTQYREVGSIPMVQRIVEYLVRPVSDVEGTLFPLNILVDLIGTWPINKDIQTLIYGIIYNTFIEWKAKEGPFKLASIRIPLLHLVAQHSIDWRYLPLDDLIYIGETMADTMQMRVKQALKALKILMFEVNMSLDPLDDSLPNGPPYSIILGHIVHTSRGYVTLSVRLSGGLTPEMVGRAFRLITANEKPVLRATSQLNFLSSLGTYLPDLIHNLILYLSTAKGAKKGAIPQQLYGPIASELVRALGIDACKDVLSVLELEQDDRMKNMAEELRIAVQ